MQNTLIEISPLIFHCLRQYNFFLTSKDCPTFLKKRKIVLLGTTKRVGMQKNFKWYRENHTSILLAVPFPQGAMDHLEKTATWYQKDNRNP